MQVTNPKSEVIKNIIKFDDVTSEIIKAVSEANSFGKYKVYLYPDPDHPNKLSYGYVGVTGAKIEERHRWHLKDANKYPDRPLSQYLLKNPNVRPIEFARGTHEQAKEIERKVRPNSKIGFNIRRGGGSSTIGQRRMSLSVRDLLEVYTPLGCFESPERAAEIHGISKTTLSKYCNSSEPRFEQWCYGEDMLVEPCIPCYDPEDDNSKYIEAYHEAQNI